MWRVSSTTLTLGTTPTKKKPTTTTTELFPFYFYSHSALLTDSRVGPPKAFFSSGSTSSFCSTKFRICSNLTSCHDQYTYSAAISEIVGIRQNPKIFFDLH